MHNEGTVTESTRTEILTQMILQLENLERATPDQWERSVFQAVTGGSREDVDWDVEDNHAGYFLWLKSFDELAAELVEDGYVAEQWLDGQRLLIPREPDWSSSFTSGVGSFRL